MNGTADSENSTAATSKDASEHFILGWNAFLLLVGVPCNILVARIAWSQVRQRPNRVDASPNNTSKTTQLLILSLSVIDVLALIMNGSARFAMAISDGIPCWVMISASHWSTIASSLAVLCLNVDRFVAIIRPLHYAVIMTKGRIYCSIAMCWLVATGWSIFFICRTTDAISPEKACSLNQTYIGYYASYTFIFFILPNCIALALSFFVALIVLRRRQSRVLATQAAKTAAHPARMRLRFMISGETKPKKPPNTTKMLTFVFVATVWSCVTNLCYRIHALLGIWLGEAYWLPGTSYRVVTHIFLALMYSNPAGNPFVTILTQRRYRLIIVEKWTQRKQVNETKNDSVRISVYSVQNGMGSSMDRTSGR